ncbi:MAG TPA: hypothetical protein VGC54_13255 [Planctomycetota bacterium]
MATTNYYEEKKFCPSCSTYVRFLQSPAASYCAECGSRVLLFNRRDRANFQAALQAQKSGPRKDLKNKKVS